LSDESRLDGQTQCSVQYSCPEDGCVMKVHATDMQSQHSVWRFYDHHTSKCGKALCKTENRVSDSQSILWQIISTIIIIIIKFI